NPATSLTSASALSCRNSSGSPARQSPGGKVAGGGEIVAPGGAALLGGVAGIVSGAGSVSVSAIRRLPPRPPPRREVGGLLGCQIRARQLVVVPVVRPEPRHQPPSLRRGQVSHCASPLSRLPPPPAAPPWDRAASRDSRRL